MSIERLSHRIAETEALLQSMDVGGGAEGRMETLEARSLRNHLDDLREQLSQEEASIVSTLGGSAAEELAARER